MKAPPRAPNVIVFLIDDIGFGHTSAFGGAIPMPTLDRLASRGLRDNRFHTTALCSPTRVALLTGRNHHTNNAGAIMELATAFPGNLQEYTVSGREPLAAGKTRIKLDFAYDGNGRGKGGNGYALRQRPEDGFGTRRAHQRERVLRGRRRRRGRGRGAPT